INAREHGGKIVVSGFNSVGMMPAVKDGADEDVTQRAKCPAQVGVDEQIVKADDESPHREHSSVHAGIGGDEEKQDFRGGFEGIFRRMESHGGKPIHFLRAVMNGMKRPDRAQMKKTVTHI